MANSIETLAAVVKYLRDAGLPCDVFGGWAEELLGLRRPWQHSDIDLIHRGDSLQGFDALSQEFRPVPLKRFHHKRAFIFREVLCEIILVRDANSQSTTLYWGDTPFHWERPLLDQRQHEIFGEAITIVSAVNLTKHRQQHKDLQRHRWQDPQSLAP